MKKLFPGSYAPSADDHNAMWAEGTFVFDTNMLLNFHRYSDETRREFLDVVSSPQIHPRIWIPYQVALEYHRNLDEVRHEQVHACERLKKSIEDWGKGIRAGDHRRRTDALLKLVNELLAEAEQQYQNPERGILVERIAELFEGKVGPEWDSKRLREVYKEGEERYAQRVPPGFKDASSKKGDERFGDVVVWLQIIDEAVSRKKPIIFVTDDAKEDWWLRIGGKTIGPLPTLRNEIHRKAGVLFHMYTGDRFLEQSRKVLRQSVRNETVEEVKQVRVEQEKHHRVGMRKILDGNRLVRALLDDLEATQAEALHGPVKMAWHNIPIYEHDSVNIAGPEYSSARHVVSEWVRDAIHQARRDSIEDQQRASPEQTTQRRDVRDEAEEDDDSAE
ncbi:hypothetical protein SAMN05444354_118162 [Stigmatella aurantiaca]|uniref:PIN like domain-containing protein n=1 Tax=Stigmatella aurantiaca TaxID=41 RepID=A0A1H7ZET9_STIAU|nr:PIN domain-containing protein [Stigmatella aurantiaca]SEM56048.1 hypothetical protein SAMN05444354_118162 [Stigmatella aurantiaca]